MLTSKITVPALPEWAVPRPRIDSLIAQGTRSPLTVVTGPPGAGKTMAITSWAAAHAGRGSLAWVALDEYDNRPQVFWAYAVAALRRAGIAVPRLGAAGRAKAVGHEFLVRLTSALASLRQPVVLVIEDFHLLTDAEIIDGISYVLKNAGPGLHLVISSRIQPQLPLHRYRLNGELVEIRAEDLAFSTAETRLLLAQHGITLSAAALQCLSDRTEGWAAGIRLAAISLDGHPDAEQFVKELGAEDSAVTAYLVEEVLNALPLHTRDFLLHTSILDGVSAEIAMALGDDQQAADPLPALAEANAFVRPWGNGLYRYHPLFAEILRLKLRREFPDQLPDLHRRAAGWYVSHGYLTEAVRHAAAASDWELAAGMVLDELAVGELIEPRGSESIADIFRRMPEDPARTHVPSLLVTAAVQLAGGQDGTGSTSLTAAENILEHLPAEDETPSRLAAALIRMAVSRKAGDLDAAVTASARAEAVLRQLPAGLLAGHPRVRPQVLLARGIVEFWAGDADAAAAILTAGVGAASAAESSREKAGCLGQLSLVEALRGPLSHAAQLADQAAGVAGASDESDAEAALPAASTALAYVHLERNELRQAHDQLALADAALRARPDKLMSAVASLTAARCRLAEGDAAAALELVSRARQRWKPPPWLEHRLTLLESQACGAAGDPAAAVSAAARAQAQSRSGAPVALAYAWLAADDDQAARRALAAAGPMDQQSQVSLDGWLVDARLSYGSGDSVHGRRSLERALQLGKPEQLRLPFARERAWLRPILRREPDLVRRYRHLLEPDLRGRARAPALPPVTDQAPPLVVDRLSEREREVLQRLSGMLSTAEIATEMYISVNTVKTHLKSIYRKLSADHRGEAVRRARQLELITPPPRNP